MPISLCHCYYLPLPFCFPNVFMFSPMPLCFTNAPCLTDALFWTTTNMFHHCLYVLPLLCKYLKFHHCHQFQQCHFVVPMPYVSTLPKCFTSTNMFTTAYLFQHCHFGQSLALCLTIAIMFYHSHCALHCNFFSPLQNYCSPTKLSQLSKYLLALPLCLNLEVVTHKLYLAANQFQSKMACFSAWQTVVIASLADELTPSWCYSSFGSGETVSAIAGTNHQSSD